MSALVSLGYFALLIGGLIFFHELGHYLMARLAGVQVVTFSIGFGPSLVEWTRGGTVYRVAAFPLGGYVKMLGDDPNEDVPPHLAERSFGRQSIWRRFWIVFGGPLFNLALPFIVFFGAGLTRAELPPAVVGSVSPEGAAHAAGLRSGDRIVAVDGRDITYWWELVDAISPRPGEELELAYERDGERHTTRLVPRPVELVRVRQLGIVDRVGRIDVASVFPRPVVAVDEGSAAARAGLRSWDRVVAIDGRPVERWGDLERALERRGDAAVRLTVLRDPAPPDAAPGQTLPLALATAAAPFEVEVTPTPGQGHGIRSAERVVAVVQPNTPAAAAGLQPGDEVVALDDRPLPSWHYLEHLLDNEALRPHRLEIRRGGQSHTLDLVLTERTETTDIKTEVQVLVFGATNRALYDQIRPVPNDDRFAFAVHSMIDESVDATRVIAMSILGLFSGQVSVKEMGGPILVYNLASVTEERGWDYFFRMMAILSINLGLINLLPVPVLDGGHIFFLLIEAVQRRPISLRVRQMATYVGLSFILMLMILVFKNDIERNWDSILKVFGGG